MNEQKKNRQRIYDAFNGETKAKKMAEIIGVCLWPPSIPDLNPHDYLLWGIFENFRSKYWFT